MKLAEKINLQLNESRDTLFHFTSIENAYKILKSNKMISGTTRSQLSFTRDKMLIYRDTGSMLGESVLFVMDGKKLASKYKFKPTQEGGYTRDYGDSEFEELLILKKGKEESALKDVKKFIKEIVINEKPALHELNLMIKKDKVDKLDLKENTLFDLANSIRKLSGKEASVLNKKELTRKRFK